MHPRAQPGSATVEQVGLSLLVAVAMIAAIAAVAPARPKAGASSAPPSRAHSLRGRRARPVLARPADHAYGRSLAGAVRALATGAAEAGAVLLPVDFRRCRSPSCAAPGPRPG